MERSSSAVAELLRPLVPSLSDEIIAAIRREVEPYRRPLAGNFGRNVRMGVEVALTRFLEGADDRGRRAYVELGRGEFREGRSLDALLSAYRVGARIAWRRAYEAGEHAGVEPHALYELGEALFAYIDAISAESADGWAQAQSAAAGERQRRRRLLVGLLGADGPVDEAAARAAADAAGWPPPTTVAAVVTGSDPSNRGDADPARLATRLGSDVIAAVFDGALVALVPDPSAPGRVAQLERALAGEDAALGPAVPWLQAGRSIARARLARRLAAEGRLPSGFVRADDHLAALVLHADATLASELAAGELAPLRDLPPGPQAKLVATLRAWLDHRGRVEEVAHALGVHPQTVRYRLGQLRELLGDRLEDPEGRLALALALRAQ
jgi:PucR C-terminal helix-turn-helix domain